MAVKRVLGTTSHPLYPSWYCCGLRHSLCHMSCLWLHTHLCCCLHVEPVAYQADPTCACCMTAWTISSVVGMSSIVESSNRAALDLARCWCWQRLNTSACRRKPTRCCSSVLRNRTPWRACFRQPGQHILTSHPPQQVCVLSGALYAICTACTQCGRQMFWTSYGPGFSGLCGMCVQGPQPCGDTRCLLALAACHEVLQHAPEASACCSAATQGM